MKINRAFDPRKAPHYEGGRLSRRHRRQQENEVALIDDDLQGVRLLHRSRWSSSVGVF